MTVPSLQRPPSRQSSSYATDGQKWKAVLQHDLRADGRFFYSVSTTGIYCRPSCASRRPRRENVAFHVSCAAAERAGFRPCKRCQPNGPALAAQHAALVARACRIIKGGDKPVRLAALARAVGLSPFHFQRIFTRITGLTPRAYAAARRAESIRRELPRRASVTEAVYAAGYPSGGRFYAESSRLLGMPPRIFRRGGAGETIRFAVGQSSLGAILVASSKKGVCAIFLGDDPDQLTRNLQDRFPSARLIGADRAYEKVVAAVIGQIENPRPNLDLPLDIRGTVFQQKVWHALEKIPLGRTASYAGIARRVGRPKATRAVAQACGANALAVVIPCHRVIRTDGGISGYRWGVDRKRALLKKEEQGTSSNRREIDS